MTGHLKLLIVSLIVGILAIPLLVLYVNHLSSQRNADLQRSRVESCERTYHSFPLMFQPFFPADPAVWTERQLQDWEKLGARADELAAGCSQQTNLEGGQP